MFTSETKFTVPEPRSGPGRRNNHPRPDRDPESIGAADRPPRENGSCKTVTFRDGPNGTYLQIPVHVRAGARRAPLASARRPRPLGQGRDEIPPREEWLIAEWPKGKTEPTDYWISNLPASTKPGRLARLARLRWKIELDYRQLKGELGLDHYEGRSWLGWYHHTALVTAAHGFLTLERLRPP